MMDCKRTTQLRHHACGQVRSRRGSALILTMVVLFVLVSLALLLARQIRVHAMAAVNYQSRLQAEAVAMGAAEYLRAVLEDTDGKLPTETDIECEAVPVGDGYYWILQGNSNQEQENVYAFGLTDEAGKLNLNTADQDMLAVAPGLDADIAAAIIDWRDGDDEESPGGAEGSHYMMLDEPYQAKNALFESVEELLLVRGVTPLILFGEDANRNNILDASENDADASAPPDNHDGQLDRGLAGFLTIYSIEPNVDDQGQERVNVNTASRAQVRDVLSAAISGTRLEAITDAARQGRPFANVGDFYERTGLQEDEFRPIAHRLTTTNAQRVRGLINVNSAPRQVLATLPGLDDSDVQKLIDGRGTTGFDSVASALALLPREKAGEVGGRITVRSYTCSADIIAVDGAGRAFKRYWAVYQTDVTPVRLLCWRDMTSLGWPLDPQILKDLRAGQAPVGSSPRLAASMARATESAR